jgi:cytochrome c553
MTGKFSILLTAVLISTGCVVRAADAKETWEKTCAKCHGTDGKGDTKMGKKLDIKDLTDAKIQSELTDDKAFKIIKDGVKDGDKTKMKPAENLTDAEIKALVAQVRTFKKK